MVSGSYMFTGDLSVDAPGLSSSLARANVPATIVGAIKDAYKAVCAKEDLSEANHTLRTPGTSFNPRPARLMVIALKELQMPQPHPDLLSLLVTLANNPIHSAPNLSALGLAIVLIDDLRHAHLHPTESDHLPNIEPSLIAALPDRLAAVLKAAHANALMLRDAKR